MSHSSKTTSLQSYHLLLYRRALHPELFGIEGRKQIRHGDYEFESWVFNGGHALLFHHQGLCLTELVTDSPDGLPERAQVVCLPCAGERDHEESIGDRIEYVTSIQTETLSDHLYLSTYNEMVDHGRASDGLMTLWKDEHGLDNLSLVDLQRHRDEVHVQSWHIRSDCLLVLRTQTIFRALQAAMAT